MYLWAGLLTLVTPIGVVIGWKIYDVYQRDPGLVILGFVFVFWFAIIGMFMSLHEAARKRELYGG